jgi:hypothetical protein
MPAPSRRPLIPPLLPLRRWVQPLGITLVALLGAFLMFELGRSRAGPDGLAVAQEASRLRAEIRVRDATIRELRRQTAELETLKAGQDEERSEVSRTIGELQAQVARQSQDLAFYKGIVVQSANQAEVSIRQARIARGTQPGRYVLRLILVQPSRPDRVVAGSVAVTLEGTRGGVPGKLTLQQLTAGRERELRYSFRYFQNLNPELVVPAGFIPERLALEVRSSRREVAPVSRTLLWSLDAD